MVMRTLEGVSFDVGDLQFTFKDHRDKEVPIHAHFYMDPEFYKAIGYSTKGKVLEWFVENRGNLADNFIDLSYGLSKVFDGLASSSELRTSSLDNLKTYMAGHLRSQCLTVREHYASSSSVTYLLVQPSGVSEGPSRSFYTYGNGGVIYYTTDRNQPPQVPVKWGKIYNYSFAMDPTEFKFFRGLKKETGPYFGVELELSTKLSSEEIAYIVSEVEPKQEPFFIFKQDASVSGKYQYRMELVTVPCTPRYLRTHFKIFFEKIERLAQAKGHTIADYFDTSENLNNGIHIHVGKSDFMYSEGVARETSHTQRFLTAFNQSAPAVRDLLNRVSARPRDYYEHQYCQGNHDHRGRYLSWRLKPGQMTYQRTNVCHNTKRATVEVRLFQGIFNLQHIFRCISFTEAMFHFTGQMSYKDFDMKFVTSFKKFITEHRKYVSIMEVFDKCA